MHEVINVERKLRASRVEATLDRATKNLIEKLKKEKEARERKERKEYKKHKRAEREAKNARAKEPRTKLTKQSETTSSFRTDSSLRSQHSHINIGAYG